MKNVFFSITKILFPLATKGWGTSFANIHQTLKKRLQYLKHPSQTPKVKHILLNRRITYYL